eukprot:CAMPEP_0195265486 /NCGR_PEP_ID=MMETSP0706-20130129/11448_1 /TAXON_ID=33640 /ORGANISM="Asterionellopsis glacialis, Strain CCMP134" /LENGTH=37 /DNA_ID= /DNA_START= /DNA_END= /DNA_ORIENTATION=
MADLRSGDLCGVSCANAPAVAGASDGCRMAVIRRRGS